VQIKYTVTHEVHFCGNLYSNHTLYTFTQKLKKVLQLKDYQFTADHKNFIVIQLSVYKYTSFTGDYPTDSPYCMNSPNKAGKCLNANCEFT